jgi:hypothetical protein
LAGEALRRLLALVQTPSTGTRILLLKQGDSMGTQDDTTGMNKETVIPFYWLEWDQNDTLEIQFYDVTFYENFGPFAEGDFLSVISVNYGDGLIRSYTETGEVDKQVQFKAVAL